MSNFVELKYLAVNSVLAVRGIYTSSFGGIWNTG